MRTLAIFNMMSLDGFFAGPNGELDWHNVDDEFNAFAIEQAQSRHVDTLLFGRVTYELMAAYWPTPEARTNDPIVARFMNETSKVVFSRTLQRVEWENSRLASGDAVAEVRALKRAAGGSLMIFGSAQLAAALDRAGLIDEHRLMVNPVILGRGRPLFAGAAEPRRLKLVSSRAFRSGNVLLNYQPR